MTCHDTREWLLTAPLDDLRAPERTVATHLDTCPRCRTAADRILSGHAALAAQVDRQPADAGGRIAERAVQGGRALVARRRLRARLIPTAIAAAAAIGAVLLVPRDRMPAGTVAPAPQRAALPPLVADASARVAVMATRRADITVVWEF